MARLMVLPGQKTPDGKTLHYEIIHSKITARIVSAHCRLYCCHRDGWHPGFNRARVLRGFESRYSFVTS
jgi:hypothetical protein